MSSQAGSESGSSNDEDSILGQVQREAGSSRSRLQSNGQAQDPPNDHDSDEHTENEDSATTGSSDVGPDAIDLAKYRERLAAHAQDVWRHFHKPKRLRLAFRKDCSALQTNSMEAAHLESDSNEASSTTAAERVSPLGWTEAEQSAFFPSLARHSRLRPDLISDDLDGTKTAAQVSHYISLLEAATQRLVRSDHYRQSGPRRIRALPSAKEVPAHWTALEAEAARQLDADDGTPHQPVVENKIRQKTGQRGGMSHTPPVPWDSQVLNALLFLRQQAVKSGQRGTTAQIELKKRGTLPSRVSTFTFGELLHTMIYRARTDKKAKGEGNAAWMRYSQTHPVPPLPKPKRLAGAQRSKMLPPTGREADARDAEATAIEEADDIESAHGGVAYRLILRAIELGFLLRATPVKKPSDKDKDDLMPRFYLHLARDGTGIRHKRHREISSDAPAPLPHKVLRQTHLVWADKLPVHLLHESGARELARQARTAEEKLREGKKAALDRILSSVSIEEGYWLATLLQPTSSGSILPERTNKDQESIAGVDALASLSSKDRNRVRMRIKRYEAKYGPLQSDAVSNFLVPPMRKGTRLPRVGMRGVQERKGEKSSILEPFRDVIYALPPEERATARSRIRTRIVRWGLEAALSAGFDAWSDGITSGKRAVPRQASMTPGGTETIRQGENEAQPAASASSPSRSDANTAAFAEDTPIPSNGGTVYDPSTTNNAQDDISFSDKRADRFRQIGVSRQDITSRLAELAGETMFQTLNLHGLFHHLQVMNSKTRCLTGEEAEVERPEKIVATKLDVLRLLPDLGAKLRSFVEQVAHGAARQAEQDAKTFIGAAEVRQMLRERDQVTSVAEMRKREREAVQGIPRALTEDERQEASANMERDPPVDWQSKPHLMADEEYSSFGGPAQQDKSTSRALTTLSSLGKRKKRGSSDPIATASLDEEEEDGEAELFESNAEAAEVQAVRSIWASSSSFFSSSSSSRRQTDRDDERIPPMWRGFYWPNRTRMAHGGKSNDSPTDSDNVESDTSDRASSRASEAVLDSEAESEKWWEGLARQDEQRDARALREEWEKWFGGKVKSSALAPAPACGSTEAARSAQEHEVVGGGQDADGDGGEDGEEEEEEEEEEDDDGDGKGSDAIPDWLQEMMDAKKHRKGSAEGGQKEGDKSSGHRSLAEGEDGDGDGEGDEDPDAQDVENEDDGDDVEMGED
ncbi:hypothetical protein BCV69DRAFT_285296 [Microstroma glucosiphilum]|uniref:Uncharacterized protein n=1 Tax=Pseudomicrostroma glucosiphilum TaxID=1684307 RepID=A0A316U0E4_9BASI|nr:hypothetical protein BCV69DRAFT_285296 [Pseudomicrostroma glucosiphilum]PWN18328.1 hypothetical protein BCV69DRAFT_285296 [Pseudomicrostroma glucosiphilum]